MGRPPKEEARDTGREILDAALDLFARHGFHGTSMRQIARAVGVRESALYHHFRSKDALLEALTRDLGPGRFEKLAGADPGALAEKHGARRLLGTLAHRLFEEWAQPREQKFLRIMMAEGLRGGTSASLHPRAVLGRAQALVAGLFTELQRRRQVKKGDPAVLAQEFMGPLFFLRMTQLVLSARPPDLARLNAQVDAHLDFFWAAVRP